MKLWIWYWVGGGYNWCRALNREDALRQARALARGTTLVLDESSLHVGTQRELLALDMQYASLFV